MTDGNTKASVKFDAVQKSFGSVKVLEAVSYTHLTLPTTCSV